MAEKISTTKTTDAPEPLTTFTYGGTEFKVSRKPNAFILASLGSVGSGDPEALGIIVKFFKRVLSVEEFQKFERTALDDDAEVEEGFEALATALQSVVEALVGRPTE